MSEPSEQPRRRRRTPSAPPPAQGSVVKGGILVLLALIVGFVLLRDDDVSVTSAVGANGTTASDDAADEGDDDGDTDSSDGDETTSSSLPAPRDPNEVKVLVANGTNVSGAAATFTDQLKSENYLTGAPTDAEPKDGIVATSVYFDEGYESEAVAVANAIGASGESVQPLPTPAPVADTQLAHVIVVLGPDLAQG